MPIQTNLAIETEFFHVPLPGTAADAKRLNECWSRVAPKNGRIFAEHTLNGIVLQIAAPLVMIAVADEYWREIGQLIAQTGEPWWDFCATVVNSEPQQHHPHAHALSLHRVTDAGDLRYLHNEDPM